MNDKIHICNWLLTRKCNLNCSYCAIVKNYKGKPAEYPDMKYYHRNEMTTQDIIDGLKKLKKHNPDMFHLFYGGEPLLRRDIADIINFCNKEDIHYTIITNNSPELIDDLEDLLLKVDFLNGLTSSVDPVFHEIGDSDRIKKSISGIMGLKKYKDVINDLVAEITVSPDDVDHLLPLVRKLTKEGINSDITFVDIAKTPYYDFSNVTDPKGLVMPTRKLETVLGRMIEEGLDVHMLKSLVMQTFDILPSNMDCQIDKTLHNITVDADGSIRLCLRVRGVSTPRAIGLNQNLFTKTGKVNTFAKEMIQRDKKNFCRGCNHTCLLMSLMIDENKGNVDELVHLERRLDES